MLINTCFQIFPFYFLHEIYEPSILDCNIHKYNSKIFKLALASWYVKNTSSSENLRQLYLGTILYECWRIKIRKIESKSLKMSDFWKNGKANFFAFFAILVEIIFSLQISVSRGIFDGESDSCPKNADIEDFLKKMVVSRPRCIYVKFRLEIRVLRIDIHLKTHADQVLGWNFLFLKFLEF